MKVFLEQIEEANPNAIVIDEDSTGVGWGPRQFTGGSMTWEDIANTETAYSLSATAARPPISKSFSNTRRARSFPKPTLTP